MGKAEVVRPLQTLSRYLMSGLSAALAIPVLAAADGGTAPDPNPEPFPSQIVSKLEILSERDANLYRRIFALQEKGEWKRAALLISELENDILMGHVQFQKYMHPTAYRSRFSELSKWLDEYAELPGAIRIYRLARRRQGSATAPRAPPKAFVRENHVDGVEEPEAERNPGRSASQAAEVRRIVNYVWRNSVRRRNPERAERRLWAFERRGILRTAETDKMLARIAGAYFFEGNDEKALALAGFAANRSRDIMSQPDWIAGMAAWRLDLCSQAARHFDAVAAAPTAGTWMNAAGAFWASRAHLSCRRPEAAEKSLGVAAQFNETFYGQIAARQLGIIPEYEWHLPRLDQEALDSLMIYPGVRRAIALDQVGKTELADEELRLVFNRQGSKVRRNLAAIAAHLGAPSTQVLLASRSPATDALPISVRYPLPDWEPAGGYKIDRAVIFGMMRQESGFRPRARSPAGAMGLMQLMPDTASFITRDRSLRWSGKHRLYDPVINLTISQDYAQMLLEAGPSGGNLFKLAVAYNGGPGNLARWQKQMKFQGDPLLFIETIPSAETRNFIERVFSNIWIYRARLGQPAPSLDAVASGAWPDYEALDGPSSTPPARPLAGTSDAQD